MGNDESHSNYESNNYPKSFDILPICPSEPSKPNTPVIMVPREISYTEHIENLLNNIFKWLIDI